MFLGVSYEAGVDISGVELEACRRVSKARSQLCLWTTRPGYCTAVSFRQTFQFTMDEILPNDKAITAPAPTVSINVEDQHTSISTANITNCAAQ